MNKPDSIRNMAASVSARLLSYAKRSGEDYQLVLTRYALERFMYRLACSSQRNLFTVKGAMLFLLWTDELYRPTRDLDLLIAGEPSKPDMQNTFRQICSTAVENDGLLFDLDDVNVDDIRANQQYAGLCVTMRAMLGRSVIPVRVDIGFGDVVTPVAKEERFPVLLDFPAPVLLFYPRETVVAEKFEAMVQLGLLNSRMKDYYDLWFMANSFAFEGEIVKSAIVNTFRRRRTVLPLEMPEGLSNEFATDSVKLEQWKGFLRRSRLASQTEDLSAIVGIVREFILPPVTAAL